MTLTIPQAAAPQVGTRVYWHGRHHTVREVRGHRVLLVPDGREACWVDWVEWWRVVKYAMSIRGPERVAS